MEAFPTTQLTLIDRLMKIARDTVSGDSILKNNNPSSRMVSAPRPNGMGTLCRYCGTDPLDRRPDVGQLCIGCGCVERLP